MENGSILITGGTSSEREALVNQILSSPQDLGAQLMALVGGIPDHTTLESESTLPQNVDILLVKAEEGSIKTENVRAIQSWLATNPIVRKEKVAVVLEAQDLTPEAQNAFLKTLEEPPQNAFIILTAPDSELLLPTVISRCQEIALKSQKTLSLSSEQSDDIANTITICQESDLGKKWQKAATLAKSKESAITFLTELECYLHSKLITSKSADRQMVQHIKEVSNARSYLKQNCNSRLVIENLFLFW